jgi:hypothetical protein
MIYDIALSSLVAALVIKRAIAVRPGSAFPNGSHAAFKCAKRAFIDGLVKSVWS